jgi:hypothetical protein
MRTVRDDAPVLSSVNFVTVLGMALCGVMMMVVTQRRPAETTIVEDVGCCFGLTVGTGLMCNQVMIWPW